MNVSQKLRHSTKISNLIGALLAAGPIFGTDCVVVGSFDFVLTSYVDDDGYVAPSKMDTIVVYIKYAEVDITELDPSTPFEIVTQFSMTYLFDNGDFSYGDSQSYYFIIVLLSGLVTLGLRAFRYVRANKCSQCNGPIVRCLTLNSAVSLCCLTAVSLWRFASGTGFPSHVLP